MNDSRQLITPERIGIAAAVAALAALVVFSGNYSGLLRAPFLPFYRSSGNSQLARTPEGSGVFMDYDIYSSIGHSFNGDPLREDIEKFVVSPARVKVQSLFRTGEKELLISEGEPSVQVKLNIDLRGYEGGHESFRGPKYLKYDDERKVHTTYADSKEEALESGVVTPDVIGSISVSCAGRQDLEFGGWDAEKEKVDGVKVTALSDDLYSYELQQFTSVYFPPLADQIAAKIMYALEDECGVVVDPGEDVEEVAVSTKKSVDPAKVGWGVGSFVVLSLAGGALCRRQRTSKLLIPNDEE